MDKLYLPGLNGIRAIACIGVIIGHIMMQFDKIGLANIKPTDMAGCGVTMFFCLSGFLITFLLLKEKQKTNDVAIKKFYMRRILRIWPSIFCISP